MKNFTYKIAIVHDSFTQMGGAERVVDVFHEMFPEAVVYTLVLDKKFAEKYKSWKIKTTWLQYFYNFFPKLKFWFLLIPFAVNSIQIKNADIIISSSSGFVKNIKIPEKTVHINYCHTPARFLWLETNEYINQEVPLILRPIVKIFIKWFKKWDTNGTKHVQYFIANSKEVKQRIFNIYQSTAEVIYPPIDTDFWHKTKPRSNYFLVGGRLQAHKKIDWVIEIFNELNLPLYVIGTGRQENFLKGMAKANIKFLGRVSDTELRDIYSSALALIYPQVEDFGLMPVEALSSGTPTIAYAKGGALETVLEGQTGEFFMEYKKESLKDIILHWNSEKYNSEVLKSHSFKFSKEVFKEKINLFLKGIKL